MRVRSSARVPRDDRATLQVEALTPCQDGHVVVHDGDCPAANDFEFVSVYDNRRRLVDADATQSRMPFHGGATEDTDV